MAKTRQEVEKKYKWSIEDIYSNDSVWEDDFTKLKGILPGLDACKNDFTKSADALYNTFKTLEKAELLAERLYVYAKMKRDEDNANNIYQGMTDRAYSLIIEMSSKTSFIRPQLLEVPSDALLSYLDQNESLGQEYGFYIKNLLRAKPHILSENEEKLLSMTSEFSSGAKQIFTMLNNADIDFGMIDDEGEQKELTHATYSTFMQSHTRKTRENAYKKLYAEYKSNINTIASTYSTSVKKDVFYAKARNHPSALAASLFSDDVPISLYNNLIKAVHDNIDTMYDYIALRKKVLGVETLEMYDVYTPMIKEVDMEFSYEQAKDMVKNALLPLGKDYQDLLDKSYSEGWIDVFENKGKISGAYSWGTYGVHPFVLLNHRKDLNSVYTLAHELGHAIHTHYSNETQPYSTSNYTIFVAEVASTVNEILLTKYLLKNETDLEKRKYILNHYIDQFKGTVVRQTMFCEFEKLTHDMQEKGIPLTAQSLSDEYSKLNKFYYGDEINTDKNIAVEWARIPHFYNAFYVYKYATGFSCAIAIVNSILKKGDLAVEKYKNFLKSGGSNHPLELLKIADVDLNSGKPVDECMKEFKRALDEFGSLF